MKITNRLNSENGHCQSVRSYWVVIYGAIRVCPSELTLLDGITNDNGREGHQNSKQNRKNTLQQYDT